MSKMPLAGVRVIDLGAAAIGPVTTRPLVMMGAEVIHLECLTRLDTGRFGSHADDRLDCNFWETGGRHNWNNAGKLELTLDLANPKGKEVFKKLVQVSDVVSENFSARVMKNLGLEYEALKEINPQIILMSLRGWGHSGPRMQHPSYGWVLWAETGLAYLTGYADGPPKATISPFHDYAAAMIGAFAILAALDYRRRTGKGQWIDLSQYECGVRQNAEAMMDYIMNQRVQRRMGNRDPSMVQGCYPCQGEDKWVAISITSDDEWRALCDVMGNPPWTGEERFINVLARYKNNDELDRLIGEWTITKDRYWIMHTLQKAGVPSGAVLTCKDVLLDPHFRQRQLYQPIPYPKLEGTEHLGTRLISRPNFRMSRSPAQVRRSRLVGEDNDYILCDLLGISAEEVEQLIAEGVTGSVPAVAKMSEIPVSGKFNLPLSKALGRIREYDENYRDILAQAYPD